ncbi:MAG TPA: Crp/Fnr family transcriptional regulator [Terracidiphilus sp.]|jgi:CRP-like cAMP-binding protein|nr:Crp/Fnr family transcriptional regulator [Terracidiphilus sp.]
MQSEASSGRAAKASRPLAELLACPPETAKLLNATAEYVEFGEGETVFRQGAQCKGLYVVVAGEFIRKAERMESRLMLGSVRAGELVELAAALGDGQHTYSLTAHARSSAMLLPLDALLKSFRAHPPLRMHLLEELAREVSRAYELSCASRLSGVRKRGDGQHSNVRENNIV